MDDGHRRGLVANHPRERSWSIGRALVTVLVAAASVGLLLWVVPPQAVLDQIGDMKLAWVIAAVGFELASCLSYVVVFRLFFPEPPRGVSYQVAWIAMGAGAVLPGGNISSAAATSWLLRRHGIGTGRLIGRCVALLCLLIGVGFFINGVAGALLFAGVPGGPHDLLHTGGPILVSVAVLSLAALVVKATHRAGDRAPRAVRGFAAGLEAAWDACRASSWRLLGAVGFLLFDMAALWATCAATGHPVGAPAIVIAYCIGYLATSVPIPAGLGVLDSGLSAALVLYGLPTTAAVGAVLVYHAIAIWVPGLGGLIAWLPTRRLLDVEPPAVVLPELGGLRLAEVADTTD
jgi:uncharacterized membrane protein YbhN (UPF0104 family)